MHHWVSLFVDFLSQGILLLMAAHLKYTQCHNNQVVSKRGQEPCFLLIALDERVSYNIKLY